MLQLLKNKLIRSCFLSFSIQNLYNIKRMRKQAYLKYKQTEEQEQKKKLLNFESQNRINNFLSSPSDNLTVQQEANHHQILIARSQISYFYSSKNCKILKLQAFKSSDIIQQISSMMTHFANISIVVFKNQATITGFTQQQFEKLTKSIHLQMKDDSDRKFLELTQLQIDNNSFILKISCLPRNKIQYKLPLFTIKDNSMKPLPSAQIYKCITDNYHTKKQPNINAHYHIGLKQYAIRLGAIYHHYLLAISLKEKSKKNSQRMEKIREKMCQKSVHFYNCLEKQERREQLLFLNYDQFVYCWSLQNMQKFKPVLYDIQLFINRDQLKNNYFKIQPLEIDLQQVAIIETKEPNYNTFLQYLSQNQCPHQQIDQNIRIKLYDINPVLAADIYSIHKFSKEIRVKLEPLRKNIEIFP